MRRVRLAFATAVAMGVAACAGPAALPTPRALPSTATEVAVAPPTGAPSDTASPVPSLTPSPSPVPFHRFGPGQVEIPILLYHHLSAEEAGTRYVIGEQDFRAQMELMWSRGYRSVGIGGVAQAIRSGMDMPGQPFVITFDDGDEDTFDLAYPILEELGLSGVAYVVGNRTGAPGFMTQEELTTLLEAGWEVGSHSHSHIDLTTVGPTVWRQEILGSRQELEDVLGVPVTSFAYPFGASTPEIIAKVAEYGYDSAVGLGPSRMHDRGTLYYLSRREIWGSWSLDLFEAAIGLAGP